MTFDATVTRGRVHGAHGVPTEPTPVEMVDTHPKVDVHSELSSFGENVGFVALMYY